MSMFFYSCEAELDQGNGETCMADGHTASSRAPNMLRSAPARPGTVLATRFTADSARHGVRISGCCRWPHVIFDAADAGDTLRGSDQCSLFPFRNVGTPEVDDAAL